MGRGGGRGLAGGRFGMRLRGRGRGRKWRRRGGGEMGGMGGKGEAIEDTSLDMN